MSTKEAQRRASAKYDATHTRFYGLKLNAGTDAKLIEALDKAASTQGFIKAAIKAFIGEGKKMTDIEIMMADGHTTKEAEALLKAGSAVYDSADSYIKDMAECGVDVLADYNSKEEFEAEALAGHIENVGAVRVEGKTRIIMYAV